MSSLDTLRYWCAAQIVLTEYHRAHAYRALNRARRAAGKKLWNAKNVAHCREYRKSRYATNPAFRESVLRQNKESRQRVPLEVRQARSRAWATKNPALAREYYRNRAMERYRNDPAFNLARKIRRRIHMALRRGYRGVMKADKTIALLGCSYAQLQTYIEAQFLPGMMWADVFSGRIHLDHRHPLEEFDLSRPKQQAIAFHFTNLQPLWSGDNIRKGAKILRQTELSLA